MTLAPTARSLQSTGVRSGPFPQKLKPGDHITRACFAEALAGIAGPMQVGTAQDYVKKIYGDDPPTQLVLRGDSVPANSTSLGWASDLVALAVPSFIESLLPLSAGAALIGAAPSFRLDGVQGVSFPKRADAVDATTVTWVAEGAPIPVVELNLAGGALLGPPKKLAVQLAATRELLTRTDAERIFSLLLRESCAFSLDSALFSNTAASTARPAGILNGTNAISASTAGDETGMMQDLAALSAAIAPVTNGLVYVMNPAQANALKLWRGNTWPADVPVWSSGAVAEGVVIALDPQAFVSGYGSTVEIRSGDALVHMSTVPLEIVSGTGPTTSDPQRSTFQTDTTAIMLVLRTNWCWRVSGAVAWITGADWGPKAP